MTARNVLCALYFVFLLSVPLSVNGFVDAGTRMAIFDTRPYLVVIFSVLVFLYGFLNRRERLRYVVENNALSGVFLLSLASPVYHFLVALSRPQANLPVVALYFVWAGFSFLVVPILMQRTGEFLGMMALFAWANAVDWVWSFVLSMFREMPSMAPERLSFGYLNALYYGEILQVVLAVSVLTLARLQAVRAQRELLAYWLHLGIIGICTVLMLLARSRNSILTALTLIVSYRFLSRGSKGAWWLLGAAVLIVATLGVGSQFFSPSELDDLSSGRLRLWNRVAKGILYEREPVRALLVGPEPFALEDVDTRGEDVVDEGKAFYKKHVDNFYIEQVMDGGLLGLALFVLPYAFIFRLGLRRLDRADPQERVRIAWSLSVMLSLAVQGLFISTVPSFGNPIGMFTTFAVLLPGLYKKDEPPAPAFVARPRESLRAEPVAGPAAGNR